VRFSTSIIEGGIQEIEYRMQETGWKRQNTEYRSQKLEYRRQNPEYRRRKPEDSDATVEAGFIRHAGRAIDVEHRKSHGCPSFV
jgi:hypothetical protein